MTIEQTFDYKAKKTTYRFQKKALLQALNVDEEQLKKIDSEDIQVKINSRYIYLTFDLADFLPGKRHEKE